MSDKKMVRRSAAIALGIICIVLVVVGLVGAVTYIMPMINDKNNTISSLNSQTSNLQNQNNQLQTWLDGNKTLLNQTQTWLDDNTTAYSNYVKDHHYTNEQYSAFYDSVYILGYKYGFAEGNTSGYNAGYQTGLAAIGFDLVDPTNQQMLSFMATDTVHKNVYNSSYIYWNFCDDYINEAFKAGWLCGFVYIEFPAGAHSVVCFNTTDRGIVFVEPQSNIIVNLAIGLSYWSSSSYQPATYNDTIVDFAIIW